MEPYRIVLANEPRLLRGLLHYALAKAAGMKVVDEVIDPGRLTEAVAQGRADWVIVSLWRNGNLPLSLQQLVKAQPAVSLLGLAADGSQVKVYGPGADHDRTLRALSLSDLLATLRTRTRAESR